MMMAARLFFATSAMALIAGLAGPVAAQTPAASGTSVVRTTTTATTTTATAHRWGPRYDGRWYAGWAAPGGWQSYQRPRVGFALPAYWVHPRFFIANYGVYGLPAPTTGYGWSRYYDDAVMTDQYGRVRDVRSGIDWSRYEGGYEEGAPQPAVIASSGGEAGYSAPDDMVTYSPAPQPAPQPAPSSRPGVDYDAPAYASSAVSPSATTVTTVAAAPTPPPASVAATSGTHWSNQPATTTVVSAAPPVPGLPPGGYISGGFYYPPPLVTTIIINPDGTTQATTRYATEAAPR